MGKQEKEARRNRDKQGETEINKYHQRCVRRYHIYNIRLKCYKKGEHLKNKSFLKMKNMTAEMKILRNLQDIFKKIQQEDKDGK